jgi:hypothetical protein
MVEILFLSGFMSASRQVVDSSSNMFSSLTSDLVVLKAHTIVDDKLLSRKWFTILRNTLGDSASCPKPSSCLGSELRVGSHSSGLRIFGWIYQSIRGHGRYSRLNEALSLRASFEATIGAQDSQCQ